MNMRKNFIALSSEDLSTVAGGISILAPALKQVQDNWNKLVAPKDRGFRRDWPEPAAPLNPMGLGSNPLMQ